MNKVTNRTIPSLLLSFLYASYQKWGLILISLIAISGLTGCSDNKTTQEPKEEVTNKENATEEKERKEKETTEKKAQEQAALQAKQEEEKKAKMAAAQKEEEARKVQEQTPQSNSAVFYKSCAAVRAAGKAPIHRGEPGYGSHLDRDGDGIACEK